MASITMAAALNQALDEEMDRDERVFLIGEDIPDPTGGAFQVTKGLSTKYGLERVLDSPISEQAIIGASTGAAMAGMRPVAEIMICDFLGVCMDQLANHAAKLRFMSGGATTVPMVVRTMGSGGINFGGQHSQMLEAWLVHTPGLKVCIPSTPADAKGLLTAAIRDPDPVVIIEPCVLYSVPGEVPESAHVIAPGTADIKRAGSDVTVVTYGRQVHDALAAAEAVAGELSVEVIDLRWLQPWDVETVLASARKTTRVVVVHQAVQRGGFGGEVAAVLQEHLFGTLTAPILRVAGKNTPVPYATELESFHIPSAEEIATAIRAVAEGSG
ncbi:MAG TPA: alpha-ketoacid dehydrogenase subunit beta [Solirubrobacteraceae bacterium]|jgi:pyruvate dehydrogenase E1 component beta subunit|nr:alpha-ketoacid dehydrogenase subunit beta [Solirubrobacteraceae bacterium]